MVESPCSAVLKPQTYMNRSGAALAPLRSLPGFDPSQHLLILVDEVALPLGSFGCAAPVPLADTMGSRASRAPCSGRITRGFASASGRCRPTMTSPDFVLDEFTPDEDRILTDLLDPMADAVERG